MAKWEEELVFMWAILSEKLGAIRTFLAGPGQPPHIIPGLFEWMNLLAFATIGIDSYFRMIPFDDIV
ncbi:hypothetical protein [Methanoregula sp.]|uniref:hypothetical protein n=1 Tax=Methanoregula sp. TaxID=2052170 RepID=UPI003BAECC5D